MLARSDIVQHVFKYVKDKKKCENLVSEILPEKLMTFVAWKNIESGIPIATVSTLHNDKFKIICQNVVLISPQ